MNFKVEQRLRKLQFIQKTTTHTTHHLLIHTLIEWYQVTLGLTGYSFSHFSPTSPYIQSRWFENLIKYMSDREKYKCIMEEVIKVNLTAQ